MNGNGFFSVIFALLLIYFVIKHDWSKHPGLKSWFPYLFFTVLIIYIINYFLLLADIDVMTQFKNKDVLDVWKQKFGL